jgi:hypothetical protein
MSEPSYTINEWCKLRKISRSMFYALDEQGRAPHTHRVGVKRLISPSADQKWLAAREAESMAEAS